MDEQSNTDQPDDFIFNTQLVGHLSLAQHFGIDLPSDEDSDKLKLIWLHIKDVDPIANPESVLMQIERRLGSPRLGENMIDKVYRWLRLKEQSQIVNEKLFREEQGNVETLSNL